MNATDTKKIERAISALDEQKQLMETLKGTLNEKLDGMSDAAREGDKGEAMQTAINALEEFEYSVDEAISKLEEARDA